MSYSIVVGKRGTWDCPACSGEGDENSKCICSDESELAFCGSAHFMDAISDVSRGFSMLTSRDGSFDLSECASAIEEMRLDLQRLEQEGVPDFDPLSADTKD
ncbi:MAG: hypothetical protein AAB673_02950, partial [Patescibacteria group bacterium]